MKTNLIIPVFAAIVFAVLSHDAYAYTQIIGSATSCSGIASCHYAIASKIGNGSATTSAYVGGYVGQSPLLFSGGLVYFQLPGESLTTYGYYSGQAVLAGSSSTSGTIYHINGTIKATDANTGTMVKGSTNGYVGIKGHSGRGGGNTYTLINGTIKLVPTTQRTSLTSLACSPYSISAGGKTTCKVTVTDPGAGTSSTPTGKVTFVLSTTGSGKFSPANNCTLVSGTCSVTYTQGDNDYCTVVITSKYVGDSIHQGSTSTNSVITIIGC